MITLYVKTGCPFCAKVLTAFEALGVPHDDKNISDEQVVAELISLGGKRQVPFLVDGTTMMYESDSIVDYVTNKFPKQGSTLENKPRIHFAGGNDVCST